MIFVENLTKYRGYRCVLDSISFQTKEYGMVGLLGVNGVGKTTLMKILTGFIPPTFGSVKICGMDLNQDLDKIKSMVGYLPECTPVYKNMTVKEFLSFFAKIRGISKQNLPQRLEYVLGLLDLEDKTNVLISTLSKGYTQRVGLAQSLVHNPKILILDEPVIGLDPKQLYNMRKIFQMLKKDHLILLSTHILQEISQICDDIIVLHDKKVVFHGSEEEILQKIGKSFFNVTVKTQQVEPVIEALNQKEGIFSVEERKELEVTGEQYCLKISCNLSMKDLVKFFADQSVEVLEFYSSSKESLEDFFLSLSKNQKDQSNH